MIIPKNGRVIIIDDEIDQAFPLISALSKYTVGSNYFDGTLEKMPENKIADARIVFLDINLNGASQPNWQTERALIINAVSNILTPKNPYILFIWSVKSQEQAEGEKTHFQEVSELFEDQLIDYKPIIPPLEMGKNDVFKQEIIEKENAENEIKWVLRHPAKETIELIIGRIEEGISQVDSVEALLKWENIVGESSSKVVNNIIRLANSNGKINEDLKQIYLNLASGYWGKTLKDKKPSEIIKKALVSLNSILDDKIEYMLQERLEVNLLKEFPKKPLLPSLIKAELNTRLLFSDDLINEPIPGNIYIKENDDYKIDIVKNILDRSTFRNEYCEENYINKNDFYEGNEVKKEHKRASDKYGFRKEKEAIQAAEYIELELTPICDYSQDNRVFCRIISGVIMGEKYRDKIKRSADFFYISPLFLIKEGTPVNFYCDFRYIQSASINDFSGVAPTLRVRHLFQSDIQSHLSRQISRPGIVSL